MSMKKVALAAVGIFLIALAGCDSGAKDGGGKDGGGKDGPAKTADANRGGTPGVTPGTAPSVAPGAGGAAATLAAFDAAPPVVADSPLKEGEVIPDIEGVDTDGTRFKISDYRGKVVMIDFWGNW
jgi:hypothetical protein